MSRPYIIAADDDEGWRDLLKRWLTAEDFCELKLLTRGKDVLAAAKKRRPDLIVLDHELGDTTGAEVCASIKREEKLAGVPVIILTTLAGEMLKIVAGRGPDHFVVKSSEPKELVDVVERLLRPK